MIHFTDRLDYRTRGGKSPERKPHLLVLTHPDEAMYFETVAEDLLAEADVAVYRLDPAFSAEECAALLMGAHLLLLPLGVRGIAESAALSPLCEAAEQYGKRFVPILMEAGLLASFTAAFGEVQFLDRTAREATALTYRRKLSDLLSGRILLKRTYERIEGAFDANLFISYRKRDRAHAVRLLRMLHADGALDIGLWYDEFLTAGEDFNSEIQAAIERADAVLLVVTPSLLEKGNYVLREELPYAAECQKPILPILFEPIDLAALGGCDRMLSPISAEPGEVVASVGALLGHRLDRENDGDAEHLYLLGMASLVGYRTAEDPARAYTLFERSAALGNLEARDRLAHLLEEGRGCPRDPLAAVEHRLSLCAAYDAAERDMTEYDRDLAWDRYLAYCKTCRLFLDAVPPAMRVEEIFRGAVDAALALPLASEELGTVLEYYGDHRRECADLFEAERYYREAIDAVRGEETVEAVRVLLSATVKLAHLYDTMPRHKQEQMPSCAASLEKTVGWLLSEEGIPTMASEAADAIASLAEVMARWLSRHSEAERLLLLAEESYLIAHERCADAAHLAALVWLSVRRVQLACRRRERETAYSAVSAAEGYLAELEKGRSSPPLGERLLCRLARLSVGTCFERAPLSAEVDLLLSDPALVSADLPIAYRERLRHLVLCEIAALPVAGANACLARLLSEATVAVRDEGRADAYPTLADAYRILSEERLGGEGGFAWGLLSAAAERNEAVFATAEERRREGRAARRTALGIVLVSFFLLLASVLDPHGAMTEWVHAALLAAVALSPLLFGLACLRALRLEMGERYDPVAALSGLPVLRPWQIPCLVSLVLMLISMLVLAIGGGAPLSHILAAVLLSVAAVGSFLASRRYYLFFVRHRALLRIADVDLLY